MPLLIGREQRVTRVKEMRVENVTKENCSLTKTKNAWVATEDRRDHQVFCTSYHKG